jgi:hypothetical protein
MAETQPDQRSGDMKAMESYWATVAAILGGADAIKAAKDTYLPKFANESDGDYKDRLNGGKFSNIFRDIVENLAAKPFAKQLDFASPDKVPQDIKDLAEDIDGQGNHLHVFAASTFFYGIANAVDWIFVDKTPLPAGATVAQEKQAGARPYWLRIPAGRVVAAYSAMIEGTEQFVHFRYLDPDVVRSGYGEAVVERVRVLSREPVMGEGGKVTGYAPATWEVLEKREKQGRKGEYEWVKIDGGDIAIGIIPIVPFLTGRREEGSWRLLPPMKDAAHLQIKHYQGETNLEYAKVLTSSPMLSASGVTPPTKSVPVTIDGVVTYEDQPIPVPVGPKTVLYAPMDSEGRAGEWKFIEIGAQSLKFLAEEIKRTEQQLRELGRQPLTAQTGNLTVVTTAFAAQKGNSAVQAWALALKDALELALKYTSLWIGRTEEPELSIHTDFALDMESDKAPDFLLKLREAGDISRKALINEAKRRDLLGPEYDEETDLDEILAEMPGEDDEDRSASLPPGRGNTDE